MQWWFRDVATSTERALPRTRTERRGRGMHIKRRDARKCSPARRRVRRDEVTGGDARRPCTSVSFQVARGGRAKGVARRSCLPRARDPAIRLNQPGFVVFLLEPEARSDRVAMPAPCGGLRIDGEGEFRARCSTATTSVSAKLKLILGLISNSGVRFS